VFIGAVNDTGDKLFTGVNDIGDKLSPVLTFTLNDKSLLYIVENIHRSNDGKSHSCFSHQY
jgi:hypothetical protein